MRKFVCLLFSVLLFATAPGLAGEENLPLSREEALKRIVASEKVEENWFADSFLNAVSRDQLQLILAQIKTQHGAFVEVKPEGKDFLTIYERGIFPTKITLDDQGKVIGLLFLPPRGRSNSLEEVLAGFKALPGKVSVLATVDGKVAAEINADEPLAVGSAFKLAVLAELQRRIETGKLTWNKVEPLRREWKSLPSGMLQDWPDGTPMTLQTLATLMISRSDNTATDHLIQLLGAESIEKISPRNAPFLTTAELFRMKYGPKAADLAKRYEAADAAGRRALLEEVRALPLPAEQDLRADPVALGVEWYFSVHELAALMEEVKALPLMTINPGLAGAHRWKRVAYKGGSEPGVICMVAAIQTKDGPEILAVATWNNPEAVVDESRFSLLYGDLAEKVK